MMAKGGGALRAGGMTVVEGMMDALCAHGGVAGKRSATGDGVEGWEIEIAKGSVTFAETAEAEIANGILV